MKRDIVYAEDDLSSIGSESAFGEDIPSDVSVGSETSTLEEEPLDTTVLSFAFSELSVDLGYDAEFDTLSDRYESDLESDCEPEEEEEEEEEYEDVMVDLNSISPLHFQSGDAEITDDELSFVSDDFDPNVSFSDDEDGLSVISESSRFEESLRQQLKENINEQQEGGGPIDVDNPLMKQRLNSLKSLSVSAQDKSQSGDRIVYRKASRIHRLPEIRSLDTSFQLQRPLFRLPSRSASLNIEVCRV